MKAYIQWFIWRVFTPISWFASSIYITRTKVNSPNIEFLLGVLVLLLYAIILDFPQLNKEKYKR